MNQFIAHSSLDCIEDLQWASKEMYLKTVDKFNNTWVSCFLTGGSTLHTPTLPTINCENTQYANQLMQTSNSYLSTRPEQTSPYDNSSLMLTTCIARL